MSSALLAFQGPSIAEEPIEQEPDPIEPLRRINARLHEQRKQEQVDAECSLLQALRPTYAAWEGRVVSEAIEALQEGNRYPECAPMSQVLSQIDAAIERDLEACREILRRQK
jgi:hypothetical protein